MGWGVRIQMQFPVNRPSQSGIDWAPAQWCGRPPSPVRGSWSSGIRSCPICRWAWPLAASLAGRRAWAPPDCSSCGPDRASAAARGRWWNCTCSWPSCWRFWSSSVGRCSPSSGRPWRIYAPGIWRRRAMTHRRWSFCPSWRSVLWCGTCGSPLWGTSEDLGCCCRSRPSLFWGRLMRSSPGRPGRQDWPSTSNAGSGEGPTLLSSSYFSLCFCQCANT